MDKKTAWTTVIVQIVIAIVAIVLLAWRVSTAWRSLLLLFWVCACVSVASMQILVGVLILRGRDPWVVQHCKSDQSRSEALYVLVIGLITAALALAGFTGIYKAGAFNQIPERLLLERNIDLRAGVITLVALLSCAVAAACIQHRLGRWKALAATGILIVIPSIWLLSRAAYAGINIRGDEYAPRELVVKVVDRFYVRYPVRRTTGTKPYKGECYIVFGQWPDPRLNGYTWANSRECFEPGTCLKVGYRQGHLGDPWLDSLEPIDCRERLEGVALSVSRAVLSYRLPPRTRDEVSTALDVALRFDRVLTQLEVPPRHHQALLAQLLIRTAAP